MTYQLINIGLTANDQRGDPLRTAFTKINQNFSELYNTTMPSGPDGAVQFRASANLTDIAYLNGTWTAVGTPNRIYTSTDFTNWTTVTSPSSLAPISIIDDSTQFIITGTAGLIMTGTDGATWTVQSSGTTSNLNSIAYNSTAGLYVAIGASGTILRSSDSTTWSTMTSPVTTQLNSVIWQDSLGAFVAVGDQGVILVSVDGSTWNQAVSNTTLNLNGVASYLNTVVTVGQAGLILASQDLVNWNIRTSGTTQTLDSATTVIFGTTPTAFAVGINGEIISSSDAGFVTWDSTTYPTPTTATLHNVRTLGTTVVAAGDGGTLIDMTATTTWTDSGIPVGIQGSSEFVFDPVTNLLSIDASIIPQTDDTWSLGNTTNRFRDLHLGANGVTIGTVTLTETSPGTLTIPAAVVTTDISATTGNIATLGTTDITVANTATIANLVSTDANIANLSVANLTIVDFTTTNITVTNNVAANNATFTGTVTAASFIGDGSQLTGVVSKATAPVTAVQFADANLDFAGSANFTYDTTTDTLTAVNVDASNVTAANITAFDVAALTIRGDGANITNLPVQSIAAGTNVTVSNVAGVWTINATGGNGNSVTNSSHLPLNSIQTAAANGAFDSSSAFTYDQATANVTLVGGNINSDNFYGNLYGNVTGDNANIANITASEVRAVSLTGNLTGNVTGNVTGTTGTFTGNVTAGNLAVGNISVALANANVANIGNIRIFHSNIMEVGTNDFVINAQTSNLVINGANNAIANVDASFLLIRGGNVTGNATGGQVTIMSGPGGLSGNGGTLELLGGAGGNSGHGGTINIIGGNSGNGAVGGSINIISGTTIGDATTIFGSNLYLQAGNTVNEDAGTVFIQGANATGPFLNGGDIRITAGTASLNDGNIYIGDLRWPVDDGLPGQVIGTDGNGILGWEYPGGGSAPPISDAIANGITSVFIPVSGGNVDFMVDGNPNVMVVTSTGANIQGTLNVTTTANVGALNVAGNTNLGSNSNITLTGGRFGDILTTDGAGALTWTPATVAGNSTMIIGRRTIATTVPVSAGNVTIVTRSGLVLVPA